MTAPFYADDTITLHHGDSLAVARTLESGSVDCIVTSPPYYGLRDYGSEGQYGLEETPAAYVETMRALFNELRRVLADDGTLWLNLGDSYNSKPVGRFNGGGKQFAGRDMSGVATSGQIDKEKASGLPAKNLMGIPWRVAFALQDDGWILRNEIIWHKPNGMPTSVTDRLGNKHEHLFLFSKKPRYWFDLDPIREELSRPEAANGTIVFGGKKAAALQTGSSKRTTGSTYGKKVDPTNYPAGMNPQSARAVTGKDHSTADPRGKNPGDVWTIPTTPFPGAHFAVFPKELARRCILSGCKPAGTVLDPFSGSGTTGGVAQDNGRRYVGIDISAEYLTLSLETRLQNAALNLGDWA